jgi:hypothetical protein
MPKTNSRVKKLARELAEREGARYTEALRLVLETKPADDKPDPTDG